MCCTYRHTSKTFICIKKQKPIFKKKGKFALSKEMLNTISIHKNEFIWHFHFLNRMDFWRENLYENIFTNSFRGKKNTHQKTNKQQQKKPWNFISTKKTSEKHKFYAVPVNFLKLALLQTETFPPNIWAQFSIHLPSVVE